MAVNSFIFEYALIGSLDVNVSSIILRIPSSPSKNTTVGFCGYSHCKFSRWINDCLRFSILYSKSSLLLLNVFSIFLGSTGVK